MTLRRGISNAIGQLMSSLSATASDGEAESEQRYEQLIETSPAPINLFDATGEIVWGNDAVVDLLGLDSRAELVGRSIFEFIHPDDRYTAKRELLIVVEENRSTGPTEMKLYRDDGRVKSIRVSTAPGRYDGQEIGQAVVIDETPIKELHSSLEREREFVEDSLNALRDVFYVIDTDGTLERWNDALVEVSGYTEREVREMDVGDFFVEEDAERISRSIETALADGSDTIEATVLTSYGIEILYEFRKQRLVIGDEPVGVVGIGRNISDRRARDEHLRAVDRLLQHSLRNQLNVVLGTTQLLRETSETRDSEHVDRIDAASERLLSIFDHHHHIVNLLTGQSAPGPVDLVPVLEAAVRDAIDRYPAASVACELPDSAVVSSVPEVDRAMLELIENAIDHNDRADPTVEVTVEIDDPIVSVEIVDNGPTIPEMERDVVTGETPLTPTFHSEGLGLWFVHWAVERSGGALSFGENEPRGNVVTVKLFTPKSQRLTRRSL